MNRVPRGDHQSKSAARERRGGTQHRRHVRVAAHHTVQRDNIGRIDLAHPVHKVTLHVLDPVGVAPDLRLRPSHRQIGRRRIGARAPRGPPVHEVVLDGPHPTADIDKGATLDTILCDRVDELPRALPRALATIVAKLPPRHLFVEHPRDAPGSDSGSWSKGHGARVMEQGSWSNSAWLAGST